MKKLLLIAALIVALLFPTAGRAAEYHNVTARGVDGDLCFYNVSGAEVFCIESANRLVTYPSGSGIDIESGAYFKIAGTAATATAAQLNYLSGVTAGTSASSKAVVLGGTGKIDTIDLTAWKIGGTSVTATAAKLNMIPADGGASTYLQTDGAGTWSWVAGTSGSLDDAYNSGIAITADAGAVAVTNNAADNNGVMTLEKTPIGAQSGISLTITAGANASGDAIKITNAGTGKDISGTSDLWHVSKAGLGTFVGLTATGSITMSGGVLAGASPLIFDGATPEATNRVTVAVTDPTAARTLTIPDATGSVKVNATATKNWAGAHADWTLDVNEQEASYITGTNADAGVNVLLSAAKPGACYFVNNQSGQVITFKVTGQTGGTIASGKRAYYCSDAVDLYEIWEQS